MSAGMLILRTLAEIAMVLALIFGFLKQNKLLNWQRRAFRWMRALRRKAKEARERELEQELLRAQYADEYETDRSSRTVAAAKTQTGGKKRKSSRSKVA